jgi:DNA-binding CsgD family transcriptional regulator
MAATTARWAATYDVRPALASVSAPALVIHRRDDPVVPAAQGRYLADRLPDATYVELPGDDHIFILGDQRPMIDAIVDFLDGHFPNAHLRARLRSAIRHDAFAGWESLTPSEREIAGLVAAGMTNAEIATRLRISRHTVDGRLRRVFAKLSVNSRAELAAEYSRVSG